MKLQVEKKYSQSALAELADVTKEYIHDLEHGLKSPTLKTLFAISTALEIKLHILIELVEEEKERLDNEKVQ